MASKTVTVQDKHKEKTTIRKAEPRDAHAIKGLAESLRLKTDEKRQNGFLVYILDEAEYGNRAKIAGYFYLAAKGKELTGFLMCYSDAELAKIAEAGKLDREDCIVSYVKRQSTPYIFGDQIGVAEPCMRNGTGKSLMQKLFANAAKNTTREMYVAILHRPIRNTASINFCSSLGFKQISEVTNKDGYVWGIYHTNIPVT
jgi:N-acetylglutamate synthase-like GNAT family acetyltransferase